MSVPDYETLMLPLLRRVENGEKSMQHLIAELSSEFKLTEEESAATLPSGQTRVIASRVHWAKTYLKQAGLLEQPKRGMARITERGRQVLREGPVEIDGRLLRRFPEFVQFQARRRTSDSADIGGADDVALPVTPAEQIETAARDLDSDLQSQLLARILEASPRFFEYLILDLMLEMGYGGDSRADARERLGRSGDGGVDGVIREDRLGLELVYLQAKRYHTGTRIGVDAIRSFAGALDDMGARKGVFVTTSSFSDDAAAYAKRQQTKRIILIDGDYLTRLMIRHNVAIRVQRTVEIKRIDLDYFDESETE
jgi:restriction system protein